MVALSLNAVGESFEGTAEEIFEGITMLLAAGVLTWMIFWMQKQSHSLRYEIEANVRQAASVNSGRALFALAFFATVIM